MIVVVVVIAATLTATATATATALARAAKPEDAAVVVLDAHTGAELLASGFVDRELPPGSVFKLVTALAAGAAGAPALGHPLHCPAPPPLGQVVPCHAAAGHGSLELEDALAQSCNAYFAQLGAAVGAAQIVRTAAELGLGKGTGRLPEPGEGSAGAALLGAHGEGVLVTARQLARLVRAIATGRLPSRQAPPGSPLLPRIRDGMRRAVQRGTASGAAGPAETVPIAGKTGTTVLGSGTIGWFGGFAPVGDPSVVVVIGRLRSSGHEAARAARPIFEAYFHGR